MEITRKTKGSKAILLISGVVDFNETRKLKAALAEIPAAGYVELELDFAAVPFIGSSGLAVILNFYREFARENGKVIISNAHPELRAMFKALKLDAYLNFS